MVLHATHTVLRSPVRVLDPVLCPLGFVHGYRCLSCSWAMLFPDCHVSWAVPFCYQLQAKSAFEKHACGENSAFKADPGCRLCRGE